MADSQVAITAGSGTNVDTQIPSDGTDHRQVMVLGSPNTQARVAEVDASSRLLAAVSGQSLSTPAAVAATTVGNVYLMDVTLAGNATFWLYNTSATTATNGTVVFEQSPDGTNWSPLPLVRSDTGAVVTSIAVTSMAQNVAIACDAAMEGVYRARARVTVANTTGALTMYGIAGGMPFSPSVSLGGPIPAGSNAIGTVIVTALPNQSAKGVQSSAGLSVQDIKDAGRLVVSANLVAAASVTTEALATLALNKGATASSTATPAVTSGKTFRIQALTVSMRLGGAAVGWTRFALRSSFTSTAVTATSPIIAVVEIGPGAAAVAGAVDRTHIDLPDGLELASTVSWGITRIGSGTANFDTISLTGYEY